MLLIDEIDLLYKLSIKNLMKYSSDLSFKWHQKFIFDIRLIEYINNTYEWFFPIIAFLMS